jgi:hypothetical protein
MGVAAASEEVVPVGGKPLGFESELVLVEVAGPGHVLDRKDRGHRSLGQHAHRFLLLVPGVSADPEMHGGLEIVIDKGEEQRKTTTVLAKLLDTVY